MDKINYEPVCVKSTKAERIYNPCNGIMVGVIFGLFYVLFGAFSDVV